MPAQSKIDHDNRLAQVEQLLASLVPAVEVYRLIREEWGISKRQAQRYVRKVHEKWIREGRDADNPEQREQDRAKIDHTFQVIIAGAIQDRKWAAATRATERYAKFKGVHEGEVVRHLHGHMHVHKGADAGGRGKDGEPIPVDQLGPAEKKAELDQLLARRAQAAQRVLPAAPTKARVVKLKPAP